MLFRSVSDAQRVKWERPYVEGERNDAEDSHHEEHASLVVLGSLEVGPTAVRSVADTTVVQSTRTKELEGEVEGLLEFVVDLGRTHGDVESLSVRSVLVSRSEEAARSQRSAKSRP